MAGKIIADTLEHSTAGSIATNYVVNGSSKAWVNFNGTGTPAINNSNNVSSITDIATAQQTFAFTNAMSNANYAPTAISTGNLYADANIGSSGVNNTPHSKTTSQVRMHIGEGYDPADGATVINGDLA